MIENATGLDGYSIRIEGDTIIREKEAVWTPEKIRSLGIPYPCDMEEFKKACEKVMEENDETADDLKDLIAYLAVVHDPICHLCDKKKQRSTTSEECLKCPFYAYAVFK